MPAVSVTSVKRTALTGCPNALPIDLQPATSGSAPRNSDEENAKARKGEGREKEQTQISKTFMT